MLLKISLVDRKRFVKFADSHPYRNFLQYPSWADLKTEMRWSSELLGWYSKDAHLVGAAVVLYRKVPGINKYLAYIPRGPLIDWFSQDYKLEDWFAPLFTHLKSRHVFSVKMDPPLIKRTWSSHSIKEGIFEYQTHGIKNKRFTDLVSDTTFNSVEFIQQELNEMGWQQNTVVDSFDSVQPQYVFRLRLSGKSLDDLFSEFDPLWQKKINQAEWEGVEVRVGTEQDFEDFYHLLAHTAQQEQTQARQSTYFEKMFRALRQECPERIRLYMAVQDKQLLAACLAIHVRGHTEEIYSAKLGKSDHPASYLLRWKMIADSYERGDQMYDFRGISTKLNDKDPLFEMLRFRLGYAGDACELMGEWDYPVIPMLHWAFDMYMKKR
ncbi:lipid II:glycine glycyltransferase (peptidoglycan interpeptide bridge formation enzyme) [Croceifilum oryzae]|uniref:Lipid II:glycine glycyltransferase n=1 Tax=Croceifilum oryzae TaxID=1553429 RepID=A0AAJ1WQ74_9BACL|nr:peptidoglycan bridge formation glycyltransferase FemA/FemB family protein [Croceifilum oryzae]MDQ0417252.1 lipid II:glycine glycyltransferase (peptidoglycan interpeptide bridge formation enzyme) [Croceifilum oryzae]